MGNKKSQRRKDETSEAGADAEGVEVRKPEANRKKRNAKSKSKSSVVDETKAEEPVLLPSNEPVVTNDQPFDPKSKPKTFKKILPGGDEIAFARKSLRKVKPETEDEMTTPDTDGQGNRGGQSPLEADNNNVNNGKVTTGKVEVNSTEDASIVAM